MTEQQTQSDLAVITAKRVDSNEITETAIEIAMPATEIGQRSQLTELVHGLYPDAEFRSFANEAASFLDRKLLIVAVYRRSGNGRRVGDADEGDSQQQLFAA